jgi:CheY-like chemotaxis protein
MRRVLVIDDRESIRTILSMLLSELGYNVGVAENGEEGIQLFDRHADFDLVITDISMPKMNGNEVARHIRNSDRANTPLVAITGFRKEAQMHLFDCILIKPFKLETLRSIVTRFVACNLPATPALGNDA